MSTFMVEYVPRPVIKKPIIIMTELSKITIIREPIVAITHDNPMAILRPLLSDKGINPISPIMHPINPEASPKVLSGLS